MSTGSLDSHIQRLARTVWRTRRRFMATVLAAGLLLAVTAAVAWVLGGVLLDLALPLAVPARVAVWCGWWGVVGLGVMGFLLTPAIRRPVVQSIALRIERSLGGIHNRLLTVVDLASRRRPQDGLIGDSSATTADGMVARLLDQTQQRMAGFRTSRVVPWRTFLRNLAIAAVVGIGVASLWMTLGERFRVTLSRLVDPTADIPPATWLTLSIEGDLDVLAREPFTIVARVTRGETAAADLVLVDAEGHESRQPMRPATDPQSFAATSTAPQGSVFVATLEGLDIPHRYRIEAGNTWTRTHEIRLIPRPEVIAVDRRIRLPSYMRHDTPLPVEPDATRIEAPEGSTVEFVATVAGQPAEGRLDLFDRGSAEQLVQRFDERIWFEDELPRDASVESPWRWTTATSFGGVRSFTFGYDGLPFSMRTRLEPLVLPKEQKEGRSIQVMSRSDAFSQPGDAGRSSNGPRSLSMLLEYDGGRTEIVWGEAEAITPAPSANRFVAGPLGEPGRWTRCLAPLSKLPQLAGKSVNAVTFRIDSGRLLLDRPGWVEQTLESGLEPIDFPTGDSPFDRSEAADVSARQAAGQPESVGSTAADGHQTWQAGYEVLRSTFAGLTFENRLGYSSLPVAPVEIVPTADRPPSIVVDVPPTSLTLAVADDIQVSAQAFDDWGIDAVLIRVGPEPALLGAPQALEGVVVRERPPQTNVPIDVEISAELLGLAAGRSAAWQIEVHDTKGQIALGPIHRVTVVMPPEHALAKTQVPALEEAIKEAEKAAKEAMKKSESIDEKREAVLEAVGEKTLDALDAAEEAYEASEAARKPDGTADEPLAKAAEERTAEALKTADEAVAALEAERKRDLEAVDAFLESQRKQAEKVANAAQKAAEQAANSPLVPESQKNEIARLAQEARAAEHALRQDEPLTGNAAKLDRVEDAGAATAMAKAADDLAEALAEASVQLDAAGAAMRLESLADDLGKRAESLAASAAEVAQPPAANSPAADSPATPPNQPPAKQEVAKQIRELEQILGRSVEGALAKAAEQSSPSSNQVSDQAMEAGDDGADESPGDTPGQPEPASPDSTSSQPPAKAVDNAPAAKPDQAVPDTKGQPDASDGQPEPSATGVESTGTMAKGDSASERSPPASGESGEPSEASDQGDAGGALNEAAMAAMAAEKVASRVDAIAEGLSNDEPGAADNPLETADVREALAMADRARRLQARAAREAQRAAAQAQSQVQNGGEQEASEGMPSDDSPAENPADNPSSEPSDGGALAGRTDPLPAETLRGLSPAERAAIERLPPRVRDPLLEGMRTRGPAAYRGVIDAYFRQLGREIPK